MRERDRITNLLVLALCGLSGATSGVGLWWIFDQNTETVGNSVAFAVAATVMLQALIVRFWEWAATAPNWKRRLTAGLFGAVVSLASAGFASGSYIFAINKSGVEKYLTDQNASTVTAPLGQFSNKMTEFSGKMLNVASDAQQKASIESKFGGTCAGDKPQKTCGPKCRLRQRQEREADAFSKVSRSFANNAIDIIGRLQGDQSRAGMLQAFKEAHNLAADPKLSSIASWLQYQIAGFNGQFLDPETNSPFVCRDPEMVKRMSDALSLITSGFKLPAVPPEPVTIGFRDAIGKSYHDAFELAWMLLTGKSDRAHMQSLAYSYAGYGPALAVEILIIALIFFRAASERDLGHGLTSEDLFNAHLRELPPRLRQRYRAWVNLILDLLLEQGKAWYFARPVDGSPEVMRQCIHAAILTANIGETNVDPAIEQNTPAGEAARRAAGAMLTTFKEQFASIGVPLGARYDSSPVIAHDGAAPADSLITYTPTSIPGGRASHFWLDESRTYGSSLYDRLGIGFTLLRLGPHAPDASAIVNAAAHRNIPFMVLDVADTDVRDFYDCDLALIRPDQYVAWRGNAAPADAKLLLARLVGVGR
jgi:hypothetical protein